MLYQNFSSSQIVLLNPHYTVFTDQVSVVGIVPWHGFDGPWIELRWHRIFHLLQQATRTYLFRRPDTG